jgi:hypothetical protein
VRRHHHHTICIVGKIIADNVLSEVSPVDFSWQYFFRREYLTILVKCKLFFKRIGTDDSLYYLKYSLPIVLIFEGLKFF